MRSWLSFLPVLAAAFLLGYAGPADVVTVKTVTPSTTTSTTMFIPSTTTTVAPTTSTVKPTTTTAAKPTTTVATIRKVATQSVGIWDRIGLCEAESKAHPGTIDWALDDYHDGGLQFHPKTWTAYVAAGKPYAMEGYPPYAYQATREMQIAVAIRVRDGVKGSSDPYLDAQGMGAWPNCP